MPILNPILQPILRPIVSSLTTKRGTSASLPANVVTSSSVAVTSGGANVTSG